MSERREHSHGWTETAHGDFFLAANFIKAGRIQCQDFFDGKIVLPNGRRLIFVVIEVGGGEQENVIVGGQNLAERVADGGQRGEVQRAESNRDKRKTGIKDLQKGNLHFERVFAFVSERILTKERTRARNLGGQSGIDVRVAERRAPDAEREHGGVFAVRKM